MGSLNGEVGFHSVHEPRDDGKIHPPPQRREKEKERERERGREHALRAFWCYLLVHDIACFLVLFIGT